jgi:hypothetical protein
MQLAALASWSIPATAFLAWVDGLLEPDPEKARAQLGNAVSAFERLERRVELGRCLIDVARAERRLERDPAPTLENARDVLQDCGAWLFVDDLVDEERSV